MTIGAEQSANLIQQANAILTGRALDSLDEEHTKEFDSIAEAFSKNPDSRSERLEEFVANITSE